MLAMLPLTPGAAWHAACFCRWKKKDFERAKTPGSDGKYHLFVSEFVNNW